MQTSLARVSPASTCFALGLRVVASRTATTLRHNLNSSKSEMKDSTSKRPPPPFHLTRRSPGGAISPTLALQSRSGGRYLDAVSHQVGHVLLTAALQPVKDQASILFHLDGQVGWEIKKKREDVIIIK